ncbi:protein kinase family protein [Nocardioides sp. 1609]|uniref:protein kinase family protein n=1 Tax=Nocardioides sp. 1609 TaxID=2508327 RepID=UPI00106F4312|nr:protein kinase family protein [Nocardioides sp. 1609]
MPHATRPGDLLGDRYRLVDLLTESGGGRFWRAHDRILERHVAVHVIAAGDERAPALMAAARRSATVLDRRMLRVLDAEVTDEVCYVVNEWGWGTSLDIVVTGTGPLGPRRAAWLVAEVADSLALAHEAGVAHGRLNPENVLIDRAGGIRIIGLCVDAALHGVTDVATEQAIETDVEDLAGLLYCAITTKWAGPSRSIVAAAPCVNGEALRPRQVRAGVPRPLDALCDDVLHHTAAGDRHRETSELEVSARGIAEFLSEFVGDGTGMPEALLAATPDVLPDEEQVVLPPVPELRPHLADEPPEPIGTRTVVAGLPVVAAGPPTSAADGRAEPGRPGSAGPAGAAEPGDADDITEDRPTEAGVPIFGDDDDVSWLQRRTTPAPPPPPFVDPPERPLFAPAPAAGEPVRVPRAGTRTSGSGQEFWPWDTGTGAPVTTGTTLATVEDEPVPGRTFLRLATMIAAVVVLVLAVVVAVNLGRGKNVLGGEPDPAPSPSPSATTGAARLDGAVLTGLTATGFDPQGASDDDGAENDSTAPNAVDGDPDTTWTTLTYNDQLGPPPGLKTGVGLLLDLGGERTVTDVDLTLDGAPTAVSLYVSNGVPEGVADLDPVAEGTAEAARLSLPTVSRGAGVRGTHLVVWLTSLPRVDGRFRGSVAEVVVRGE